jgi:hypothetical protein
MKTEGEWVPAEAPPAPAGKPASTLRGGTTRVVHSRGRLCHIGLCRRGHLSRIGVRKEDWGDVACSGPMGECRVQGMAGFGLGTTNRMAGADTAGGGVAGWGGALGRGAPDERRPSGFSRLGSG